MFACNDEIVSKKDTPELYDWVELEKNKIKEEYKSRGKKNVKLSAETLRIYKTDDGGTRKLNRMKMFPSVTTFLNEEKGGELQTWAYIPNLSSVKRKDGIIDLSSLRGISFQGEKILDIDRDIELIFYFKKLSRSFKKGKIKEIDAEKQAREYAEKMVLEAQAKSFVYDANSPISPDVTGNENVIKTVAAAWGVSVTSSMSVFDIKNQLWTSLQYMEKTKNRHKRGMQVFVNEVNSHGSLDIRSNVNEAIKRDMVWFDSPMWKILANGETEENISFATSEQINNGIEKEALIKTLKESQSAYDLLLATLKQERRPIISDNAGKKKSDLPALRSEINEYKKVNNIEGIPSWNELKRMNLQELQRIKDQFIK